MSKQFIEGLLITLNWNATFIILNSQSYIVCFYIPLWSNNVITLLQIFHYNSFVYCVLGFMSLSLIRFFQVLLVFFPTRVLFYLNFNISLWLILLRLTLMALSLVELTFKNKSFFSCGNIVFVYSDLLYILFS